MNQDGRVFCCYCGTHIVPPLRITVEHIIPLSKGGRNNQHNKAPCCNRCNSWRGNLSFDEFVKNVRYHRKHGFYRDGYTRYDLDAIIENALNMKRYADENILVLRKPV